MPFRWNTTTTTTAAMTTRFFNFSALKFLRMLIAPQQIDNNTLTAAAVHWFNLHRQSRRVKWKPICATLMHRMGESTLRCALIRLLEKSRSFVVGGGLRREKWHSGTQLESISNWFQCNRCLIELMWSWNISQNIPKALNLEMGHTTKCVGKKTTKPTPNKYDNNKKPLAW